MLREQIVKLYLWYQQLPISKKVIFASFLIWVLQAIPKWGFVLFGDGEVAAMLMTALISPRSDF
jgi:hypothetical protein